MFPHKGIETEMPMALHGVHEVRQRRLEPFAAEQLWKAYRKRQINRIGWLFAGSMLLGDTILAIMRFS